MIRKLLLAVVVMTAACHKPPPAQEEQKPEAKPHAPVKVSTAPVEVRKMPRFLTLTGSVIPSNESQVAANVAGRIIATFVERGQPVKKGQTIAIVDSLQAGLSAAAAEAQLHAAETQQKLLETECQRADRLFSQGVMSKAEYDRTKTQCQSQSYSADAVKQNADLAAKLKGDTVIKAPFDGVIGERFVNVGEYVQPPSRVASVVSVDPVRVQISVPEAAVAAIQVGQTLNINVIAYADRKFPAVVKYVSPSLRAQTRDLLVEAVAMNGDGALKPGMFATVSLLVGEEELPTVPADAVVTEGTVKRLFLTRDGHAEERVVRTGLERDGRVAVLENLTEQDKVIVKPPQDLRDGAAIQ